MNIPKVKPFPDNAVQCDSCGGHGCSDCEDKGWYPSSGHPNGRKCYRDACDNPIPPNQVAVYCTNKCAADDA